MVLLLVDLLGVKAKWRHGRAAVSQAFADFEAFVVEGLRHVGVTPLNGGIDSDAAAFTFAGLGDCLAAAQSIYMLAFDYGADDQRYWLRGVVVPVPDDFHALSVTGPIAGTTLTRRAHAEPLLDAIAVEQSGRLRGMRLLVRDDLLDAAVRRDLVLTIDGKRAHPVVHLAYSKYPDPIDGNNWCDYIWFATDDLAEWKRRIRRIRTKNRHAAPNDAEALQAAATRLVFDEWRAILGSIGVDWTRAPEPASAARTGYRAPKTAASSSGGVTSSWS